MGYFNSQGLKTRDIVRNMMRLNDPDNNSVLIPGKLMAQMEYVNKLCDFYETSLEAREMFIQELFKSNYENVFKNILESREEGVTFLMRLRQQLFLTPESEKLTESLKNILKPFFGVAGTNVERISLESSGVLLDRVITGEQVHPYMGINSIKKRFGYGRRCFGLFSRNMPPTNPLVFVHVALVEEIAPTLDYIRDSTISEQDAKAAIFYTISNVEPGLQGIDMGNMLIKRVVPKLMQEFPQLRWFSTLSPIPGFSHWLQQQPAEFLDQFLDKNTIHETLKSMGTTPSKNCNLLLDCLHRKWWHTPLQDALRPSLERLVRVYLLETKREGTNTAKCPVANFHLRNGAKIYQINWGGDKSIRGIRNSASLMVNYLYDLDEVEENGFNYRKNGDIVNLLQPCPPAGVKLKKNV